MDNVKKQIRDMMLEDIYAQGEMIKNNVPRMEEQARAALNTMDVNSLDAVYMTGCGDSYYVGEVARMAFLEYAKMPARAIEAYEFSQYESRYLGGHGLVIAVSVSGQVGTTLSTLDIAKEKGFATLGVNGTPGSKIYNIADGVIDIGVRVREPGPVPQTYHYLANMTALFLIALNIGLKKGTITQAEYDKLKEDILYNLSVMGENARALKDQVMKFTSTVLHKNPYVVIGGGSNFATSMFAVAKMHEAACMGGIYQETEEWNHEQYFMTNPDVISLVIAAPGQGMQRSKDVLRSIGKLGCTSVAIVDAKDKDTIHANEIWSVKMADNEVFSPMSLKLPLELFAYAVAELLDIRPFDYDNEVRKKTCEETIYDGGVSAEEVARRQN